MVKIPKPAISKADTSMDLTTDGLFTFLTPGYSLEGLDAISSSIDALGDSREEVFVYNGDALWIYANAADPSARLPEPMMM